MKKISLVLGLMTLLFSCRLQYGLKNVRKMDESSLRNYARKVGCGPMDYCADSSFLAAIRKKGAKDTDPHVIKNHLQPIQCLYFDASGYPQAYYNNCYAKPGLFHLHWNKLESFDTFPPKGNAPLDSLITAQNLAGLLKPLHGAKPFQWEQRPTVVVFRNRTFNRFSRDLIRQVKRNTAGRADVKVYYVNNDRFLKTLLSNQKS